MLKFGVDKVARAGALERMVKQNKECFFVSAHS